MSTLTLGMASPNALKRTYAEAGLDHPTYDPSSPVHFQSVVTPPAFGSTQSCTSNQIPLGPQHSSTASTGFTSAGEIIPPENAPAATSEPAVKKAKLTFAEKEVKRIEKEFKDRQKAEEKAKREEEKTKKEEERARKEAEKEAEKARREEDKRAKDAEKEEKRRVKEEQTRMRQEEKKQKEDERQKKEEEKNKKARSQLRLNAFFVQPSSSNRAPSGSPARDGLSPLSSRRSSISDINAMEAEARHRSRSISSTPQKPRLPDYERSFPPFFVQSHTTLAPTHRFCRNEGLCYAQERIDEALLQSQKASDISKEVAFHPSDLLHISPHANYRSPLSVMSVKDIVAEIDGVSHNPVDLTESQFQRATKKPLDLLKSVPVKILKFAEDVRPPYIGTYTRLRNAQSISRLARNPFRRELPETNYDYDSEAEWEEPGEGEDLDSEGEEEIEDEDEADMEGFLDDEETDARAIKRRPILGDLEPSSSGVCWEGPQAQGSESSTINLLVFKLDILMEQPQLPIDPYCSSYWQPKSSLQTTYRVQGSLMEPPRIPLNPTNRQNTILPTSATCKDRPSDPSTTTKPPKPPPRLLPPELMEDFKEAVQGNELTKVGLLEVLKKQFPKQPKDSIRHTLEHIAERVGSKVQDKKWVLKSGV